jgi:replicative DNA helicase
MDTILTGFKKLDAIIGGINKKEILVIGARPSIGKTTFALSLINNISLKNKISTCFVSLEMPTESIIERLISYNADIKLETLKTGEYNKNSFKDFVKPTSKTYDAPLYFLSSVDIHLEELKNEIKDLVNRKNLELVIIDYLGLLSVDKSTTIAKQTEIIVKELKSLAIELNIAIIALSQLKRDAESQIPQIKDLHGGFYNETDVLIFMHRNRNDYANEKIATDLIIAKNRGNKELGNIQISFLPKEKIFEE